MSENSTANASVNAKMGLAGWLTLVFVILKLDPGGHLTSPVVTWPWWLVFLPVILAWSIIILILLGVGLFFGGAQLLDTLDKRRRQKEFKETKNMTPQERREYFQNKRKK